MGRAYWLRRAAQLCSRNGGRDWRFKRNANIVVNIDASLDADLWRSKPGGSSTTTQGAASGSNAIACRARRSIGGMVMNKSRCRSREHGREAAARNSEAIFLDTKKHRVKSPGRLAPLGVGHAQPMAETNGLPA